MAKSGTCHECRCHMSPPCIACVNCNHYDIDDESCRNDCQDCVGHRG